jgi:tetratricopeptide (TPR) repeat protein
MAMGISACKQRTRRQGSARWASRLLPLLAILIVPGSVWPQANNQTETSNKTVLGVRNPPLKRGAELLLAGRYEEGVKLTHEGLQQAFGFREEEAALSNLCAGYLQLGKYDTALQYCELLLARNDKSWRAYNNRALIYIKTKQWDKAEADLIKGEELNAGAYTMKVARSMYMDAVYPVAPEIEIDDRETKDRAKKISN